MNEIVLTTEEVKVLREPSASRSVRDSRNMKYLKKSHPTKKLNLLLADRDEIALACHRKIAENSGIFANIQSANDGLHVFDLLNLAAEGAIPFPDIMLFDLDLPTMNGIILLKVLQKSDIKEKENISLVVLASSVPSYKKEIAGALGVSLFLSKPFSDESLQAVIRSLYPQQPDIQISAPGVRHSTLVKV